MANEDIYGNKKAYERLGADWVALLEKPDGPSRRGKRKYYCKNKANLVYFEQLHKHFESRDTSYVRRRRVQQFLLFLTSTTEKDLAKCGREDVDELVAGGHKTHLTPASKSDFLKNVKWIWRVLFPVMDEEGRIDDTLVPYPVRHLTGRVERSGEKLRNDRLTFQDVTRLVTYFNNDARMQAYVTLALESLGRPQEICYTRIGDVELHDGYARVWVSSHGKEGVKFLQCIDAYPYLLKWMEQHPFQGDKEALLFYAGGEPRLPMRPNAINKHLRAACKHLGIEKSVTAYSLKRNGVTLSRLRGDTDAEIQHRAGWTSTKQLQTYDLSTPEDSFSGALAKRGLVDQEKAEIKMDAHACVCGAQVGFADRICRRCKRVVAGSRGVDLQAEPVIRKMLAVALEQPELSLAQVLDEWGAGQGARSRYRGRAQRSQDTCSSTAMPRSPPL